MSLLKSTATIGFYTLLSRVLGFVRDMTIASALGAGMLSDAFFVAFKIPNFLRRLFAEGAFNAAFVPLYAGILTEEGKEAAAAFAEEALSFLVAVLLALSMACIAAMPWLMLGLAPGFAADPPKYDLTVLLTRITFPYIIFISVVCLLGGILNSAGKFAAVAATPIILNLCLLIVPPLIGQWVPTEAHALAIAVFTGGIAQMLWLLAFCWRLNLMPRLRAPRFSAAVKKLLVLIAPAAMGAGVAQINLFVDLIIVSQIASGVSYLYYADRINELPLAVIGIGLGTVLLPTLSRQIRAGSIAAAHHSQNRAIELSLLLSLPAAAALMVIAEPIVRVLYERGAFALEDSLKTKAALMAFAAGLPAFVLVKVLSPAFYAHQDTKTPFRIAVICVVVNFLLNITLIIPLAHVGMALATTIAGWLNVALMVMHLRKKRLFAWDRLLLLRLPRLLAATLLMACVLAAAQALLLPWFSNNLFYKVTALALLVGAGLGAYGLGVLALRAVDAADLRKLRPARAK